MSALRGKITSTASIVAAVFVVFYCFAPQARFLQWDDAKTLLEDPAWRGLGWENLKWMWASRHYGPWQPLSWLSWCFDYQIWGLNPTALRRTNVALHSITAGLFFLVCRRLLPHAKNNSLPLSLPLGAAGAALFFALHPLRVESVLWITERRDVLSGLFAVLSVYLWLEERRRWSALAFAGAVLSKGTALAVLPFIFIIERRDLRKAAVALLPHLVIGIFAACKNVASLSGGDIHSLGLPLGDRVLVAMSGAWFYLSKTLWPMNLSPYYALSLNGDGIRQESYPGALLATLIFTASFHRRVRSWAAPVWLAYLAALLPVSGLFQNGRQAAADRYSYLACMPFAILFGWAAQESYLRRPRTAVAGFCAIIVLLTATTIHQEQIWRDDVSLWTRAVAVSPDAYLPNSNLSVALLVAGRGADAIPSLEAAIALEPRDAEARVNLASILAARGENVRAISLFREAVNLKPNDPSFASARFNLGILLIHEGRKDDGLAQLREAVRFDPSLKSRVPR
jgi:tetratricopeptide (TPR) repeat protein